MSLKFNAWSRRRIREGRKFCTSRNHQVLDAQVLGMVEADSGVSAMRDDLFVLSSARAAG